MTNILLIDKPKGITSHDCVDYVRKITGVSKVGHAGTLDPNASGLLIIGVGREATKGLSEYLKMDKSYEARIKLGEESETDDTEGEKRKVSGRRPSLNEVKSSLEIIKGKKWQVPPAYSALKVGGIRAYKAARLGQTVELKKRPVRIEELVLVSYRYPYLTLNLSVSSGTYIRSIARELGKLLDTGAYLAELRRTRIGELTLEQAQPLNGLGKTSMLI